MIKKHLKEDLERIFEDSDIVFADASGEMIPHRLYVDLGRIEQRLRNGKIIFKVEASLIRVDEGQLHRFGFFLDRVKQTKQEFTKRFTFASTEESRNYIDMQDDFTESSIEFSYIIELDYDTPFGKIRGISFKKNRR